MKFKATGFGGIAPKKHPKFLSDNEAQSAVNIRGLSGAIDSWRTARFDFQLARTGDIKTIYQMADGTWLHWNEVVNVTRSAISNDTLEKTYFTGTDVPRVTSNTMADIGGSGEFPESSYKLGVPAPTLAPTAALNGTHTTPEDTAYVYTFVTGWGEEGPPSPVSNTVAADFSTGSVDITTMDYPVPSTDLNILYYRIYRVATGTAGAEFLFVKDVLVNNGTPQANDAVVSSSLGEPIPSAEWIGPPAALIGLTAMANGMMAGFIGNTIYFCEPFLPHAWPLKYTLSVDFGIVGLSAFGNTLVVLTDGFPSLITGAHPDSMSVSVHKKLHPCLDARSIVPMNDGVAYASPDGIYFIGSSGSRLLTRNHYSKVDWSDLKPEAGQAGYYDGRYIKFFESIGSGIIFGEDDYEESKLRELGFAASSCFSSQSGDRFYMGIQDPDTLITSIYEFNAGGEKLTYNWTSKLITTGKTFSFTALKVQADYGVILTDDELAALEVERAAIIAANAALMASDVKGSVNSYAINENAINSDILGIVPSAPVNATFVVRYYVDNVVVHETTAINNRPIRLPSVKGIEHYVEVSGKYPIYEIILASSIKELVR